MGTVNIRTRKRMHRSLHLSIKALIKVLVVTKPYMNDTPTLPVLYQPVQACLGRVR